MRTRLRKLSLVIDRFLWEQSKVEGVTGMWGQTGREKRRQDLAQPCLLCTLPPLPVYLQCACLRVDGVLAHLAEAPCPYPVSCRVLYPVGA